MAEMVDDMVTRVGAMAEPTLTHTDQVFVISYGADENVTTDAWATEMNALLDQVEAVDGPKLLVTTGGAKHYSNGLDVSYMSSVANREIAAYVRRIEHVVRRIMLFPAPTVAAVNGHAFGMGAFLLMAHDQAVMREDRGFFCFPEIHLDMSFPSSLMAVAKAALSPQTLRVSIASGARYSGPEARAAGIVNAVAPLDRLLDTAIALGRPHANTAGPNLTTIKEQLYPDVVAHLGGDLTFG